MKLRLGTRKSLLAMAQSRQVVAALQATHPGLEVELVGITTHGDRDQSAPLWQMDTVGIFTRDIDEKLLTGEIDFAVHSMKDLGTQRPGGLTCAAIPPRAPPYDVALFRPEIMEILASGRPIKIGTSAPRRNELVPKFLTRAMPKISSHPIQIETVPLRGNVDTRLKRLHEIGDRALDGVLLAFAGLSRLYADEIAQPILEEHLRDLRWMVLPITHCPGAPGQGALAIETRGNHSEVIDILRSLHDPITAAQIQTEMNVLSEHGGGCHQRFGVTTLRLPQMESDLTLVRGSNETGKPVDETCHANPPDFARKKIWHGKNWNSKIFTVEKFASHAQDSVAAFIAHSRALPDHINSTTRLWASGATSWFKLAERGLWIEGCADGFGFDFIRALLAQPVLRLPPLPEWEVYTHADATEGWTDMHACPTYRLIPNPPPEAIAELAAADVIIWSSAHQWRAMHAHARTGAIHACGTGKTAEFLRAHGVKNLVILPQFD